MTEWYRGGAQGIEQGFTIQRRFGGGAMVLEMEVTGELKPVLLGNAVSLEKDGRPVLKYAGLRAWDSRGRDLAARMDVLDGHIRLVVRDEGATYPVTVDPWVQEAVLTPNDSKVGNEFDFAVAVSGDTAVVGAPGKDGTGVRATHLRVDGPDGANPVN